MQMRSRIMGRLFSFVTIILLSTIVFIGQQKERFSGEGHVVAYRQSSRCAECPGFSGGAMGTQIEHWIVKVDRWIGDIQRKKEFVLVEYQMYDRSPSEEKLKMTLRFQFKEWNAKPPADCFGIIVEGEEGNRIGRRPVLSDYKIIGDVNEEGLKEFQKFPCLIVDRMPEVVDSRK